MNAARWIGLFGIALAVSACGDADIRGSSTRSADGETYLIVADDNGGKCGPLLVDGIAWPHGIDQPGRIAPGSHRIACGTEIAFDIPAGTTYTFDYWGP